MRPSNKSMFCKKKIKKRAESFHKPSFENLSFLNMNTKLSRNFMRILIQSTTIPSKYISTQKTVQDRIL